MKIILATHNKNKVKEMQKILSESFGDVTVTAASDEGFTSEIEENGSTFEENALIKARAVRKNGYISVADDSGLCVNALGLRPGIYSARYAGEPCDDTKNNLKLLSELADHQDRSAYFVSAIGCVLEDGTEFTVTGKADGIILTSPRGNAGFGYDPLFIPDGYETSFAQMSAEAKNAISHRGRAVEKLAAFLKEKHNG